MRTLRSRKISTGKVVRELSSRLLSVSRATERRRHDAKITHHSEKPRRFSRSAIFYGRLSNAWTGSVSDFLSQARPWLFPLGTTEPKQIKHAAPTQLKNSRKSYYFSPKRDTPSSSIGHPLVVFRQRLRTESRPQKEGISRFLQSFKRPEILEYPLRQRRELVGR